MKERSAWRPIKVNLEELDRIVDHGMRSPLSESDAQKIKAALHAMADRLTPKRSTEKTSAVLDRLVPKPAMPADEEASSPAGHGRHGAAAFAGATKVLIPHAAFQPGDACPEMRHRKSLPAKGTGHISTDCGASSAEDDDIREGAAAVQRRRTDLYRGCARVRRSR